MNTSDFSFVFLGQSILRRTMPCNIDVDYDPIQNRGVM
jgi:hypothetical protein